MRPRNRVATAIVPLMAAIFVVGPVAATSPWEIFKQVGTNAFASNEVCTDNPDGTVTCENQSLDVFEGTMRVSGERTRKGEQVCYSESSSTFDPGTGEGEFQGLFGCSFEAGALTIDGLTSITLAPTVVDLTAIECDSAGCTESPGGSATVIGTWTGVGTIVSQKGRFKFDDGSCLQVNADSGRFRQASFQGSIEATHAMIGEGSFTFRTNCSF